ncbi:hypothetical protein DPMN_139697 [Dreissena polymorpha]|uniref:Uncharacterized protein n=1 Tax=Dreissena polymorpha TaxID=45954 RepID=A0A9D4G9K8_DREPO|nr:hypothetical protein DPMN_139697 [Dreissena polymorpha]
MAPQRPTRLVMGPCIVEIDPIVIREVQYQLEMNWCRNEEIIVKGNFAWAWPMWAGCPRVGNGAIHKVQYQFEVNRCRNEEIIVKGIFGWAWPMWVGFPRVDSIVIRKVQYQFEVNHKTAIFGGRGLCGRGPPGLVMGPCIVEIDRIVIREVRYQFEDNQCRNEEIIFQGSSAYSVGGDSGQDGHMTDRRTAEIPTISKLYFRVPRPTMTNRALIYTLKLFKKLGSQIFNGYQLMIIKLLPSDEGVCEGCGGHL